MQAKQTQTSNRRRGTVLIGLALGIAFMLGVMAGSPLHDVHGQAAATAAPTSAPAAAGSEATRLIELYKRINPSVVTIQVRIPAGSSAFDLVPPDSSGGGGDGTTTPPPAYDQADASGFVYSTDGYLITNAHVVEDADRVQVTFSDDTALTAKVIGFDRDSDLAVIKVETDASRLIPLQLADSDALLIGQHVAAIGNAFGYAGSMSQGIISGLNRQFNSQHITGDRQNAYKIPAAIQTDTAINPGNSGGPLLDMDGRVVGVNTAIKSSVYQSSGVGFAVSSNLVKRIANLLIKNGKVEHTYLGVSGTSLDLNWDELIGLPSTQRGALVGLVTPRGPADKAGLKAGTVKKVLDGIPVRVGGDIIVAIDGTTVRSFDDLIAYLFLKTEPGQIVTLGVLRDGQPLDIKVTLDVRPS